MPSMKLVAFAATGVALGACAIRPLPEHVTGVNTVTIVAKTRCEAREAILLGRIKWLQDHHYPQVTDEDTLLANEPTFDKRTKDLLNYFSLTGIVYSFTLDGTESGGATFTADVIRPLAHTTTTLTPTANDSLTREDIRSFTISDSFAGLLAPGMRKQCEKLFAPLPGPNYQYPIVGRIGIDEIVHTFIELTFNGLSPQEDVAKGVKSTDMPSASSPIAMVDTLNFTTTVGVGLTAKAVFSPPGMDWRLADATLPLSAARTDKHQVIIGLALAGPMAPSTTVVVGGVPRPSRQPQFVGSALTHVNTPRVIAARVPRSNTGEAAALDAVNAQILRFEVPKSLVVVP
jgi:hypothetical protein